MDIIILCVSFKMFLYEALGLCEEGKGGNLIDNAKWIKNKNGNLIEPFYYYQNCINILFISIR